MGPLLRRTHGCPAVRRRRPCFHSCLAYTKRGAAAAADGHVRQLLNASTTARSNYTQSLLDAGVGTRLLPRRRSAPTESTPRATAALPGCVLRPSVGACASRGETHGTHARAPTLGRSTAHTGLVRALLWGGVGDACVCVFAVRLPSGRGTGACLL
jgi:hypothetical protein